MSDDDSDQSGSSSSPDVSQYSGGLFAFDPTLAHEAILGIKGYERQPLPVSEQPPGSNPPTGTGGDGEWTYVRFIPEWTKPDWSDEPVITITEHGKSTKMARRDYTQMIRPALLPRDASRNPTPYALRYGIHPDEPGGRSKVSPTTSETRQVGLSCAQNTITGFKAYVDHEDLSAAIQSVGDTRKFLDELDKLPEHDPQYEHLFAMRRLLEIIEDDRDYQKVLFTDMTTDERIMHKIHSLDPVAVPQSTLSGDLHPLLERGKWVSTTYRGDDEDKPRFVFNLCGTRGEYSAENELVWAALQPALHLASNILKSKHPTWLAILDLYSRRKVGPGRRPIDASQVTAAGTIPKPKLPLYAVFDQFSSPPAYNNVEYLRGNSTYDVTAAAAEYLQEHFSLEISSAYLAGDDDIKSGKKKPVWGVTRDLGRLPVPDAKIHVEIASEMLWPLLVPSYTMAEKATSSLMIANVLLHELAHAANFAVRILFGSWRSHRDKIPQLAELNTFDPLMSAFFDEVARCTEQDKNDPNNEPYYREEQRAELGYAFEKQIWGGVLEPSIERHHGAFPLMTFRSTDISMEEWPSSRPNPHLKDKSILTEPPLPVDSFSRPVQMTDTGRLFQKSFWETDAAKFGHRALRLGTNELGIVTTKRTYLPEKEKAKVFGASRARFLDAAMNNLRLAGHAVLVMYLTECITACVGPVAMRRRMHQQAKVWPARDDEVERLWKLCMKESGALMQCYQLTNTSDGEKMQHAASQALALQQAAMTLDEYKQHLLQDVYAAVERLLFACLDLHQFMIVQIEQTQHLVLEYLQLKLADRSPVYKRYMLFVHGRLELTSEAAASNVADMLKRSFDILQKMSIASTDLAQIFANMVNKLESDQNLFQQARQYMTKDSVQGVGSIPTHFSSVPQAAYERRLKRLEKLAFRELKYMPKGLRQLADACFRILQVNVPPQAANAQIDPALAAQLATAPPVPPAWHPNWLSAQNQPKPTTVTNMGATALPQLSPQLYTALHLQANPQPQPAPAYPPAPAPYSQRPPTLPFGAAPGASDNATGPTWGTWGNDAVNKDSIAQDMLDSMFGGPTYQAEALRLQGGEEGDGV